MRNRSAPPPAGWAIQRSAPGGLFQWLRVVLAASPTGRVSHVRRLS